MHWRSETISPTYDALGRKTSETNQMGLTRSFSYDADGRLSSVVLPAVANPQNAGALTNLTYQYGYNAFGRQTLIRDPLGRETRFTFDERGNQLSRTLPLGVETTGDPNDFTETFSHDDLGRQTLHVSFEGAVTQSIYDAQTGRLSQQRFFTSLTAYNGGAGTPSETWTYNYDAFDRVASVVQSDGATTRTTTYDAQGRVASITSPEGVLHYEYDPATGLRTRTYTTAPANPSNVVNDTRITYDLLGRPKTVQVFEQNDVPLATPQTTSYQYDLAGNLDQQTSPNGAIVDYVYDNLNRLDQQIEYGADATPGDLTNNPKIAEFDYTLQADGKRTAATETFWWDGNADGVADPHVNQLNWTYDALGRLTDEALSSYDPSLSYADHFIFDLVGNRLAQSRDWTDLGKVDETTTSTFDHNDRLLTSTDAPASGAATTTTYSYGPANAWTEETGKTVVTGAVTTRSETHGYDLQGRMNVVAIETFDATSGALASRQRTTYEYDSTGIRTSALLETDANLDGVYDTAIKTEFLVDPQNLTGYSQVLQETTIDPATGQVQKVVVYTIGLTLISQTTTPYTNGVAGTPQTLVFGYDGHGSVRVLLDMASAIATVAGVQQLFHYDAYGNLLNLSAAQAATEILYSGQMLDAGTGWYNNRARWYDSQTGRFNRVDPFFGDLQDPQSLHKYLYAYLYANGDPVTLTDPTGQGANWNQLFGYEVEDAIETEYSIDYPGNDVTYGKWARLPGLLRAKPDILDHDREKYMEIKPLSPSGIVAAEEQMLLRLAQFGPQGYHPDPTWHVQPSVIYPWGIPTVFFNVEGVLFYTDVIEVAFDYVAIKAISSLWSIVNSGLLARTVEVALGRIPGLAARGAAAQGARTEGGIGAVGLLGLI